MRLKGSHDMHVTPVNIIVDVSAPGRLWADFHSIDGIGATTSIVQKCIAQFTLCHILFHFSHPTLTF